MENNKQGDKDKIYKQKKEQLLTTVSFLMALKVNLDPSTAYTVARDAFTRYMTSVYEKVLESTNKYSKERFDRFRKFYEDYAKKTPYLEIIESSQNVLKVNYSRCPFYEILTDSGLEDLAYSFCLSDPAFTEKVLPGVVFSRTHEIAKGASYCDHTWEFMRS